MPDQERFALTLSLRKARYSRLAALRRPFQFETEMTLPLASKDASASKAWLRALEMTARIEDAPWRTFPVVIEELGTRFGDAPALLGQHCGLSHA